MKKRFENLTQFTFVAALIFLMACNSSKMIAPDGAMMLDTLLVKPEGDMVYRASRTKKIDILHTKLNL